MPATACSTLLLQIINTASANELIVGNFQAGDATETPFETQKMISTEVNSFLTKLQKPNHILPNFPLISEQLKQKHFKIAFFDICKNQKWLRR